jgi:hypothetical protein
MTICLKVYITGNPNKRVRDSGSNQFLLLRSQFKTGEIEKVMWEMLVREIIATR